MQGTSEGFTGPYPGVATTPNVNVFTQGSPDGSSTAVLPSVSAAPSVGTLQQGETDPSVITAGPTTAADKGSGALQEGEIAVGNTAPNPATAVAPELKGGQTDPSFTGALPAVPVTPTETSSAESPEVK